MTKIFCILIFSGFSFVVRSQDVRSLCKKHVEKLGGINNIKAIENLSIEQVSHGSNNTDIPIQTIVVPGKVFYQEMLFPGGKSVVSAVNDSGWMLNTYLSPEPKDLSPQEVGTYLIYSNVFGPLYDYYANGDLASVKSLELAGEEQVNGYKCFKIKVIYKSGYVSTVCLSKTDYMIRKGENIYGSIVYEDYKKINNVMLPFTINLTNEKGTLPSEVISIKANKPIDYSKFNKQKS